LGDWGVVRQLNRHATASPCAATSGLWRAAILRRFRHARMVATPRVLASLARPRSSGRVESGEGSPHSKGGRFVGAGCIRLSPMAQWRPLLRMFIEPRRMQAPP
jgi:hypothetical protein